VKHVFVPIVMCATLVLVVFGIIFYADSASALNIFEGVNAARGEGQPSQLFGDGSIFTTIVNVLLFIIGALSVIMLIIGGFRYTLSGGNSSNVTAAKNTILYAIVGLVIAFLAFAVINFVLTAVAPGGSGGAGFTDV
jgi:hypothetical protein